MTAILHLKHSVQPASSCPTPYIKAVYAKPTNLTSKHIQQSETNTQRLRLQAAPVGSCNVVCTSLYKCV